MTSTIRSAAPGDAEAMGSVHVRAWQGAYRGVMPDEYLDGLRAEDRASGWRRHLSALPPGVEVHVIEEGGRVVGFAVVGPDRGDEPPNVGELFAINIDPDAWGRGLGRALLRLATDRLAHLGYTEAVLWVVPQNTRARHLYEAEGWHDDGVERHDEVFGVAVPEMRYRRSLTGGRPDDA